MLIGIGVDQPLSTSKKKPTYSPFNVIQSQSIVLGSDSKIGKLNVGIRGNTDVVAKKSTKNVVITSTSADGKHKSQMALNWIGGEGTSTNGIFDSIMGGGYQDLPAWNTSPKVVITFDDGWLSVYNYAYQYMKTKGIKGTSYLVPTFIDTAGYMTQAQIDEMYADGWCNANHTYTHPNMSTYTYAQAYSEIGQTKDWLRSKGYLSGLRHIAFPNGAYNTEVLRACSDLGLTTARKVGNVLSSDFSLTDSLHLIAPITCGLGGASPNFAAVKTQIDNAIAQGKVCIMMFHRIVNVAGENGSSTTDGMNFVYSDFKQVMDYLKTVGAVTQTIDEFYNSISDEINVYKANARTLEFNADYQQVQRTGKVILDGSLNWTTPTVFQTNVYRAFVTAWSTSNPDVSTSIGSNHVNFNDLQEFLTVDAINGALSNRYQVAVHTSGNLYISYDKVYGDANGLTTAAALKAWLNSHPITMIYQKLKQTKQPIAVTITTDGVPDTSFRSFGSGTVITVSPVGDSTVATVVESHAL